MIALKVARDSHYHGQQLTAACPLTQLPTETKSSNSEDK